MIDIPSNSLQVYMYLPDRTVLGESHVGQCEKFDTEENAGETTKFHFKSL